MHYISAKALFSSRGVVVKNESERQKPDPLTTPGRPFVRTFSAASVRFAGCDCSSSGTPGLVASSREIAWTWMGRDARGAGLSGRRDPIQTARGTARAQCTVTADDASLLPFALDPHLFVVSGSNNALMKTPPTTERAWNPICLPETVS